MSKATAFVGFKCSPEEKRLWESTWPDYGELSRVARDLLNRAAAKAQKPTYLNRPTGNEYATE